MNLLWWVKDTTLWNDNQWCTRSQSPNVFIQGRTVAVWENRVLWSKHACAWRQWLSVHQQTIVFFVNVTGDWFTFNYVGAGISREILAATLNDNPWSAQTCLIIIREVLLHVKRERVRVTSDSGAQIRNTLRSRTLLGFASRRHVGADKEAHLWKILVAVTQLPHLSTSIMSRQPGLIIWIISDTPSHLCGWMACVFQHSA